MMLPADDPAPVLVRRYYPAHVLLPGRPAPVEALVLLTRVRMYVFTQPGEPDFSAPYDRDASSLRQEYEMRNNPTVVTLDGGDLVYINRAGGCGCGNPLKTYQPWYPLLAGA